MDLIDFDFPFDSTLIADRPIRPRDHARLLVVPRQGGPCIHRRVKDLPQLLRQGDLVVVNDTKVLPARLTAHKRPGGGKMELVLVREMEPDLWEVLLKGGGRAGQILDIAEIISATVIRSSEAGSVIRVRSRKPLREELLRIGHMPLPPYIKRSPQPADGEWYQTVFARSEGAVAAPTAGLHFTKELLASLGERDIRVVTITLHVGPGTFRPVKVNRIEDHDMQPEAMEISPETVDAIAHAKAVGGRIVAVGTTVVRTLETAVTPEGMVHPMKGESKLFIRPGYQFRIVDALLTNFHLPRTTLLMLVSAFAGLDRLRATYDEAIRERYRFYSYGDAMLIL